MGSLLLKASFHGLKCGRKARHKHLKWMFYLRHNVWTNCGGLFSLSEVNVTLRYAAGQNYVSASYFLHNIRNVCHAHTHKLLMHQWALVWENISAYWVTICVKMLRQEDWQLGSLAECSVKYGVLIRSGRLTAASRGCWAGYDLITCLTSV